MLRRMDFVPPLYDVSQLTDKFAGLKLCQPRQEYGIELAEGIEGLLIPLVLVAPVGSLVSLQPPHVGRFE